MNKIESQQTNNLPVVTGNEKKKGRISIRNRKVAELAYRGWDADQIAKECGLTKSRVNHILRTDEVASYVIEISRETFSEGDRILIQLYKKVMISLDEDMMSDDAEVRHKAREQVLKSLGVGSKEGNDISLKFIQQIFQTSGGLGPGHIETMDQVILRMRKERGLSETVDDEDVIEAETQEIHRIEKESNEDGE